MNTEPLTRWSGLSRVLDPVIRNHQWIMGISLAAGAIGFAYGLLVNQAGLIQSILLGTIAGISAFLAWVQGRELDPDHPTSGLVGPVVVIPALLLLGRPDLLAGFWLVQLLRILNRSTGLPAKPLDTLALIGLTGWLAFSLHPAVVLLAGVVLLADSWLPEGHPYHRPLGALLLAAGAVYWFISGVSLVSSIESNWMIGAGVAGLFYLVALISMEPAEAKCDYVDKQISNRRERAAQIMALLLAISLLAFQGEEGLIGQLPIWSAMVGVAAFQIARKLSS